MTNKIASVAYGDLAMISWEIGMKRLFLAVFFSLIFLNASHLWADESQSFVSSDIRAKLDQVAETQQQILTKLEEISSEIKVLKVRVSQNQ